MPQIINDKRNQELHNKIETPFLLVPFLNVPILSLYT